MARAFGQESGHSDLEERMVPSPRRLRDEDLPAAAALVVDAFRVAYRSLLAAEALARMTPDYLLRNWRADPSLTLLGYFEDDQLVGLCRIGEDPEVRGRAHLYSLYVAPDCQGRGYGRLLLKLAEQALRERGFVEASLWVFADNVRANALYMHAGWSLSGRERVEPEWGAQETELLRTLAAGEPWMDELQADLQEWIRIPSVAGDPHGRDAMLQGAEWTAARLRRFCPGAELVDLGGPGPLVIASVPANLHPVHAPTYLVYGHYDVQPAGDGWTSGAFEPVIRDGWIFGRGSSDDKGQFLALIRGVESLVERAELGVNIVFLADSSEETLGDESSVWLRQHHDGLAGAILFDSTFLDERTPVINTSTRGLVKFEVTCRTGEHDLHSGLAGGAARNAFHELVPFVTRLLPINGRLAPELMVGAIPPSKSEISRWGRLVDGVDLLAAQGGRPADADAADEYYLRTWALPSLDVHAFRTDAVDGARTAVIAKATVEASIRLAPGQRPEHVIAHLERLVREAGHDFTLRVTSRTSPSFSSEDSALLQAAVQAFQDVWGVAPQLLRAGGTLPVVATLTELHVPFLLTGLHLPEGNAHGPDEKFLLRHLFDGARMVALLLRKLGGNPEDLTRSRAS